MQIIQINIHRIAENKNDLLHLYFADVLVVRRASIQQNMFGSRLAIFKGFLSKKPELFCNRPPAHPIFKGKTGANQTIN